MKKKGLFKYFGCFKSSDQPRKTAELLRCTTISASTQ